jgi:hypothetical protein
MGQPQLHGFRSAPRGPQGPQAHRAGLGAVGAAVRGSLRLEQGRWGVWWQGGLLAVSLPLLPSPRLQERKQELCPSSALEKTR